MEKKEMLSKIYEVIADKTLNFGCRVVSHHKGENLDGEKYDRYCEGYVTSLEEDEDDGHHLSHECGFGGQTKNNKYEYKIIGHPVMLGDVLDWIYENDADKIQLHKTREMNGKFIRFTYTPASVTIISLWEEKRKPIDDQSDECIKFVYDLLPTK